MEPLPSSSDQRPVVQGCARRTWTHGGYGDVPRGGGSSLRATVVAVVVRAAVVVVVVVRAAVVVAVVVRAVVVAAGGGASWHAPAVPTGSSVEVQRPCTQTRPSVMLHLRAAAVLVVLFDDGPQGEKRGWRCIPAALRGGGAWVAAALVGVWCGRCGGCGCGHQRMRERRWESARRSMGAETGCAP